MIKPLGPRSLPRPLPPVPVDDTGSPRPLVELPAGLVDGLDRPAATRLALAYLKKVSQAIDAFLKKKGADPKPLQGLKEVSRHGVWSVPAGQLAADQRTLAAGAAAEAAAVKALGERAAGYEAIRRALGGSVEGRLALQRLLLDGRLTRGRDLLGQGDLLDHLTALAKVNLPRLLPTFVQELEDPSKIAQGSDDERYGDEQKGTCVASTATILAAEQNPAELARLVAGLASPAGTVQLANGAGPLRRDPTWASARDARRTPAMKLLEPALMERAISWSSGGKLHYDNAADLMSPTGDARSFRQVGKAFWTKLNQGLSTSEGNFLLQALTGQRFLPRADVGTAERAAVWAEVMAACARGLHVPVGIVEGEGEDQVGHQVMIHAIQGNTVLLSDPDGGTVRAVPLAELRAKFTDANIPTGEPLVPTVRLLRNAEQLGSVGRHR